MELSDVKLIGDKSLEHLKEMGILSVDDLVRNYPYRFEILSRKNINDERFYDDMVIDGVVQTSPVISFFKRNMNRLSFSFIAQNHLIKVIIFNRAFMKNNVYPGKEVTVIGKYNPKTQTLVASDILLSSLPDKPQIIPVYHSSKHITSKQMNLFIKNALVSYKKENLIPEELKVKYGFIDEDRAVRIIHFPDNVKVLKTALKTLKYEEIYGYMKKVKELKTKNKKHDLSYVKDFDEKKVEELIRSLPFELTSDQKKVINDMLDDLRSDVRMNRLLQGDVGSGKTIVAFIVAYAAFTAGFQSALMAPTEILAFQHYQNAIKLFSRTDFRVGILTGKMSTKEKKKVYEKLESGQIDFLIGTHALISKNVLWNNLGLVITDEQHRFGVSQRLALKDKAKSPDVLLMSATPIPRTYALTLYGDMDVSSIKTMPKGRKKVITYVKKTEQLKDVLSAIYEALKNGNQAYVIAPMIDENEEDYTNVNDLKRKFDLAFKNYKVGILHGKLSNEEKDKVMQEYLENKINILISTTVVEVGVDVKNSTIMVIFDADRFGLSTLHQLRGRVGRNDLQSYCYLISDKDVQRLKIMEETNDGYKISEADFKLRGQGDIFGVRQSGELSFKLSDIKKDYDLILKVRDDVNEYCKNTN